MNIADNKNVGTRSQDGRDCPLEFFEFLTVLVERIERMTKSALGNEFQCSAR